MVESNKSIQNETPGKASAPEEERGGAVGRIIGRIGQALIKIPIMAYVFTVALVLTLVFIFRRSPAPSAEASSDDPKAAGTEMLKRWWLEKKAGRP